MITLLRIVTGIMAVLTALTGLAATKDQRYAGTFAFLCGLTVVLVYLNAQAPS